MKIQRYLTDQAILAELGTRLGRARLERNLTQQELAEQAGVERKVVQRMEAGESAKLTSLIRVLRALGLLDALDQLVPEPVPSPIELLKLHGKQRRRASGRRGQRASQRELYHQPHGNAGDRAPARQGRASGRRGRASGQEDNAAQGVRWQWGDEGRDGGS